MSKTMQCKWISLTLCIMMVLFLTVTLSEAKTTLKLAHCYPTSNHWAKGAAHAAKVISEKSNGEIEIIIHTDSQLGTEEQITEAVIFGSIDAIITSANQVSNLFTPVNGTTSAIVPSATRSSMCRRSGSARSGPK